MNESEGLWETRNDNQVNKRNIQTLRGNQWAKYATGSVMAPMMFVLPFPTMVDVDEQYNQQMISGGNFVRNFLGGFVLIAVFSAIFITKNWRNLSLIGSFVIAYLGIVSSSGFANSESFRILPEGYRSTSSVMKSALKRTRPCTTPCGKNSLTSVT